MAGTGERRDDELGAALRSLDIPEHQPGFHESLKQRLEQERVDAVVVPHHRVKTPLAQRRGTRASRFAAAAAVVAVAVSVGVVGTSDETVEVASAAEVRQKVVSAWRSADTVRGTLVVSNPGVFGRKPRRWEFAVTAEGDVRLSDRTLGSEIAYDVERNEERSLSVSESMQDDQALFASVRRGLAPGLPDQGPAVDLLDRHLGAVVRALAVGADATVEEITYRGRPAWLLQTDIRVNRIGGTDSPDHLSVTVDQETGFPVRTVATRGERRVWTTRINRLRLNTDMPDDTFDLELPPDAEVFTSDLGFRRVALDEVEDRTGYAPLVPRDVPDGYILSEVAVGTKPSPTGTEAGNPAMRDVVALSYRRGLAQFIVTTRPAGGNPSRWDDPLATGEGYVDNPDTVRFSDGALEGNSGELLIDPLAVPHVWSVTDELVVTVSGDLTRAELIRVAESLRAQ